MTLVARTYWAGSPWNFRLPPEDANLESLVLRTLDARDIRALYWTPRATPRPRVAVVCMHPRVDFTHHYTFPRLVAAGIGCLGATSRSPNNDVDTEHEALVLDLLACVAFLRHERGADKILLLGNSGGGSLSALYQAQARLPKSDRIARSPGGTRTHLPEADLVPAEALILVSAHRGQGNVLAECIDPSVIDEHDPRATDDSLDMYAPKNGFRPPPEWSEYPDDFVARFRDAQRARVRRLDAIARALLDEARDAREAARAQGFDALPFEQRQRIERRADIEQVMTIYRTMANLNYTDRRLDPSGRDYGSLLSDRPDRMNFALMGFARMCTPRAWLSTWSARSSNADLIKNIAGLREPVLVVNAGRDREIYPRTDARPIFEAVASPDRTFLEIEQARHYFEPDQRWGLRPQTPASGDPGEAVAPHVEQLMDRVIPWILERFDISPRSPFKPAEAPAPERHSTTATWKFPPLSRAPLPSGLLRTNLRELAARPERFEHHLMVVATIGPAQLEIATASEPVYFAHANLSDEYALSMTTGDPLIDGFSGRTFLFDAGSQKKLARLTQRAGDLVLNPYGYLHWPGQLRPPHAPIMFPPGMRRCMLSLICCASKVCPPGERPIFVSEGREDAAKAYSAQAVPLLCADTTREAARTIGVIGDATLELLVSPARIAPARGGFVVVLEASADSPYFPGDLVQIPPGAAAPKEGLWRALLFSSPSTPPDPPPSSWAAAPTSPFPTFEEGARAPLPFSLHGLTIEERSPAAVIARVNDVSAEIPRYWLSRMLFRAALHGYRIGYIETYGGLFYDDRGGIYRLGLRGGGHVTIPGDEIQIAVERLYRAVAPEGYTERLR